MNRQLILAATATPAMPDGLPAAPIVLGVVGHRDVRNEDRDVLKQRLIAILLEFQGVYTQSPLVLLSALAEGADQIAAEAALEVGAFVRAPLPFAPKVYRRSTSFDTDDGRRYLDELLKQVEWFVVPLPEGVASPETDWARVASDRDDPAAAGLRHTCYANSGGYIARRCHALIVLWDGVEGDPQRGPSGTAEQVRFKLRGQGAPLYPWSFEEPLGFRGERGLVLAVHTPRASAPPEATAPARAIGALRVLVPNDEDRDWIVPPEWLPLARRIHPLARLGAWIARALGRRVACMGPGVPDPRACIRAEVRQFRETCTTIDDFNRDVAAPAVAAALRKRLENAPVRLGAPAFDEQHNGWLLRLSRLREAAGAVSGRLQQRLDRLQQLVFILLGLSVILFHFYAHQFDYDVNRHRTVHDPLWLAGFTFTLILAIAVVAWDWWVRLDQRRLDSRALAEGLRVRRAWSLAGIGRSVTDSYVGQLRSELSWIRQAVFHSCPPAPVWAEQFARLPEAQRVAFLEKVRLEWVQGQHNHYHQRHTEMDRAAARFHVTGLLLALSGWAALSLLLFAGPSTPLSPRYPPHWFLDRADDRGDPWRPAHRLQRTPIA